MKVTGARTEPFSAMRKRALARAGAQVRGNTTPVDSTAFLGLAETDLTPGVQAAIQTLMTEIDDLRGEVGRLKTMLAEAEVLADRDPLTPLLNRRALVRELGRVKTFSSRYGSAASLVYIDLDGLAAVNDRFGHAAGDEAVKAVAMRLAANVRDTDILGRMGGDEFAVILTQTDPQVAEGKAQALARAVEREPMRFGDWSAPLHVSWGVTEISFDMAAEDIVAKADQAMYARKRARAG